MYNNIYHGGSPNKKAWGGSGGSSPEFISLNFETQNNIAEPNRFFLGVVDYGNTFYTLKGRFILCGGGIHVSVSANGSNEIFPYPIDLCYYQLDYDNPPTTDGLFNTLAVNDVTVFGTVNLNLKPQRQGGEVYSVSRTWDNGNTEIGINFKPLLIMVKTGNFVRPENIYAIGIRTFFVLKKLHI